MATCSDYRARSKNATKLINITIAAALLFGISPRRISAQEVETAIRKPEGTHAFKIEQARKPLAPERFLARPTPIEISGKSGAQKAATITPRGNHVVGRIRSVPASAAPQGVWETLPDGEHVWRVSLHASAAYATRLHFSDFSVSNGVVWVVGNRISNENTGSGPFEGRGPRGTGDFWTGLIRSNLITVQYETTLDDVRNVPFKITQVAEMDDVWSAPRRAVTRSHLAISAESHRAYMHDGTDMPQPAACEFDATCGSDLWQFMAGSVGMLIVQDGHYFVGCSGSMLNNKHHNYRPYFLTANHCVPDNDIAETGVVLWSYQTSFCGANSADPNGTSGQIVDRLLVTDSLSRGDYSLLLLQGDAPAGVVFAGWNSTAPNVGTAVACIHHPEFSWRRLSIGVRTDDFDSEIVDGNGDVIGNGPADQYYRASWSTGLTEPGSSGSPLFNSGGQVVGQLSHGNTTCAGGFDGFGRLHNYFVKLRKYLVQDDL